MSELWIHATALIVFILLLIFWVLFQRSAIRGGKVLSPGCGACAQKGQCGQQGNDSPSVSLTEQPITLIKKEDHH